ncbi:type II toxin-antitoxin system RelE/ParE family toxin [Fodinisporobacter ferrooxydans]|uniref:Type II toxin-antitoxin system RelE/ParE family toxin n=1 Tax=Fodinisporobacter ferrooxydans TaxID=2901836 RepID=A0ABY4CH62_9BACL|nr:type II toxin-antitoxin system RelE/ParE family toxin [Alicyclobacillaceae bacterium MYW30-H2]
MNSGYKLILRRAAIKFLSKQGKTTKQQIGSAMEGLLKIPPEGDIKVMEGEPGLFRLRVGKNRVLFRIDHTEKIVYVELIGPRGDVYKG